MVHVYPDRLVITIETPTPCWTWTETLFDLVRAISLLDKDTLDNDHDCTYNLCRLIEEMLPTEEDMLLLTKAKQARKP